jgi:hypothetical protein
MNIACQESACVIHSSGRYTEAQTGTDQLPDAVISFTIDGQSLLNI